MKLSVQFAGQHDPFEGDRTLHLRGLPVGGQITSAQVTLRPIQAVETIAFNNGVGDWGATKERSIPEGWVAVDLHAHRMISRLIGSANPTNDNITVQIDIGGIWVRVAEDATIAIPGDDNLTVSLSTTPTPQDIPSLVVQRLKLTRPSTPAGTIDLQQLTILSHPTNLNLRLGQMPPFWARPGELTQDETGPDFAEVLQTFLAGAEVVNGFYDVPLVVHSDTIARFDAEVEIEYTRAQTVLPEGVGEVTLPFDYNGLPQAREDLLQVALPVGARVIPRATTARVQGAFEESRVVHGPTGEVTPVANVSVNPGRSQAHPIVLEADLAADAIDLLLAAESRVTTLDLVLLSDTDGKPANESLLSQPVTILLDRDVAGTPTWLSASLPTEFQFKAGERYWLALQARDGEALWSVETGPAGAAGMQFTDNGGLSWRTTTAPGVTGPLAGFFRLRHTPARYQVPIELQVGSGDQALRVSLDRFQPLGRVDFNLDFDVLAEAINQYLNEAGPAQCPGGEHLANGDFKDWTTVSDRIMPPQFMEVNPQPRVVAGALGCQEIYLGTEDGTVEGSGGTFHFINLFSDTLSDQINLSDPPLDILVHPNGSRAYLIIGTETAPTLRVIDLINRQDLNVSIDLLAGFRDSVLTPDGKRLYVTEYYDIYPNDEGFIRAIDTTILEQGDSLNNVTAADVPSGFNPISLGDNQEPRALAIAPDGSHLYVALGNNPEERGEIHIFNVATHELVNIFSPVGVLPREMVLTPDGTKALLVDEEEQVVYVVDTATGASTTVTGTIDAPGALAVSPDGERAFVVDNELNRIAVIGIAQNAVIDFIPIGFPLEDVIVTRTGDRVYAVGTDFDCPPVSRLVSILISTQLPAEWSLTSGEIMSCFFSDPFYRTAILGLSQITRQLASGDTALSQVVPVVASCAYDFSFWGRATALDAIAEVIWLGEGCGLLRVDEVPIEVFEPEADQESPPIPPDLLFHQARLSAPEGAAQAEIRFRGPGGVVAAIDQVSFKATLETIANSNLQFEQEGQLANWVVSPATATGVSLTVDEAEVKIQNLGLNAIALIQTIPVTPEQPFILAFQGQAMMSPRSPANPQLELHWLTADGSPAGSVTTLEILSTGSDYHTLSETVPAEATEAEIHLVVPGSTTLAVKQVSFQPVELVQVPLAFIAQAPGELTVSDFQVVYELAEAPPPPTPEGGLCTPTPSGQTPGSQPGDCCFCPCCGAEKQMLDPQPTMTSANRPAQRGNCPDCGAALVQPGGQPISASFSTRPLTTQARLTRPLLQSSLLPISPAGPTMTTRTLAVEVPARPASPALPDIAQTRAEWLAKIGVDTETPLVSCIMPTYNRRPFVPQAIEYFLRQDYANRELIIVDDSTDPIGDLVPDDERIRYIRLEQRMTTGAKKNLACQEANGQLIAHWDDDDWMANWRLSYQVSSLLKEQADICGLSNQLSYDPASDRAWYYVYPYANKPWVIGGTLCYTKFFWSENLFPDVTKGADAHFQWSKRPKRILSLQDVTFYVVLIHPGNTRPRRPQLPNWQPYPSEEIQALMGEDWDFYANLFRSPAGQAPTIPAETPAEKVTSASELTVIKGIGQARAEQLAEIGIDTIAKLANASPEQIAQAVKGVSVKTATDFIDQARRIQNDP
jgi:DNA-binding beta-propeller fold protein YncE